MKQIIDEQARKGTLAGSTASIPIPEIVQGVDTYKVRLVDHCRAWPGQHAGARGWAGLGTRGWAGRAWLGWVWTWQLRSWDVCRRCLDGRALTPPAVCSGPGLLLVQEPSPRPHLGYADICRLSSSPTTNPPSHTSALNVGSTVLGRACLHP